MPTDPEAAFYWLRPHPVAVPAAPADYCDRPALTDKCVPTRRSLTLLIAPSGFGKTTLLGEACRRSAARGVPVAWVTLADDDGPDTLDAYLAYAFHAAGVDVLAPLGDGDPELGRAHPRTALLIRALEAAGRPCVIALDELERASDPAAVDLLNYFLRNAPSSLHVAIACRELPPRFDASRSVLGTGQILTAEDLRFSTPDIARFFDLELFRRELAGLATESAGWPIALRIRRNETDRRSAAETRAARHVVDDWIDSRFWEGFADEDRELVLDIALFDWIDAALLDEVVDSIDALERILALPRLAGLLLPVGASTPDVYRLHPLLSAHCAARRRLENPKRRRRIHRRVARALARRGDTVDAMRHAAQAGDAAMAGTILIEAGGAQWWLREGWERLTAADRFVAEPDADPRLAMTRTIALVIAGRLADARRAFAAAPSRPDDPDFDIDRLLARGALTLNGSQPADQEEWNAMIAEKRRVAALPTTRELVRGALAFGVSSYYNNRARLDEAAELGRRARDMVVGRSAYLTMMVDSRLGQVAMARGRVREAVRHYRSARRIANAGFLEQPRMTIYADLPIREFAREPNRSDDEVDPRLVVRAVFARGSHFVHYAAAADLATGLALATLAARITPSPCSRTSGNAPTRPASPRSTGSSPPSASRFSPTPAVPARPNERGAPPGCRRRMPAA